MASCTRPFAAFTSYLPPNIRSSLARLVSFVARATRLPLFIPAAFSLFCFMCLWPVALAEGRTLIVSPNTGQGEVVIRSVELVWIS